MRNDIKTIGFIYTLLILSIWLICSHIELNKKDKEIIEVKKFAIEIYNQDKEYISLLQQTRESLNDEIDSLNRELKEYKTLDKLKKDLR